MRQREIFIEAIQKEEGDERRGFLDAACGEDSELRNTVEELLAEHQKDDSFFLDAAPPGLGATVDLSITEKRGDTIGPFKLLQQIGEGGMGVVYMAEQKEPVKRRVALKIIKPGMDTRQVIARFEAERQALAMMDHPNIAKVLDGGETDSGRPYFVMELVNGIPLTDYCDELNLTPTERLELFIPICYAVQHAHQKGIIHRDLKPSNILVALYDGQAVPKVIDFGVAKATSQALTEKTMFTQLGQVVGTLEYMSPEQAERNQLDIDTRSDIYSLGVVLYELLTGETPFDRKRLRSAAFDEMLRIIREEEPSKPSAKVSSSRSLPSIAAHRLTEPARLGRMFRGELDWIVMKAMDKNRSRRYETVSKLAEDIGYYLNDQPVQACPPSTAYRVQKLMRRHKPAIATFAAIATALLIGTGLAIWQASRATAERDRALRAEQATEKQKSRVVQEAAVSKAVLNFLNDDLLAKADPFELLTDDKSGDDVTLLEIVDLASQNVEGRFETEPLAKAAIHHILGAIYNSLGRYEKAEPHARLAVGIRHQVLGTQAKDSMDSMILHLDVVDRLGRHEEAEELARELLGVSVQALGPDNEFSIEAHNQIAMALQRQGRHAEAVPHYRKAIEISERVNGIKDSQIVANLGVAIKDQEESIKILRQALAMKTMQYGEDARLATTMFWIAVRSGPESEESYEIIREALRLCRRDLGPDHRITSLCAAHERWLAGEAARMAGDYEQAIDLYCESLRHPTESYQRHVYYRSLGNAYAAIGEWSNAVEDYDQVVVDTPQSLRWLSRLRGRAYAALGQWEEAADDFAIGVADKPIDRFARLRYVPVLVLLGNRSEYRRQCDEYFELVRDTTDPETADVVCKLSLLVPNMIPLDKLPISVVDKALQDADTASFLLPWFWTCKALFSLRSGQPESVLESVEKSQSLNPNDHLRALNLSILALAEHVLNRQHDALHNLSRAEELVDELNSSPQYQGHHDLMIAQVLLREAQMKVNTTSEP